MAFFRLSETDERIIIKRLFWYVYSSSISDAGFVKHHFDSTWEQVCRLFHYLDPEGKVPEGYKATKNPSQILEEIDAPLGIACPSIEAFLDVALCLNNHYNGIGAKTLHDRMAFDPELHSILVSLELLTEDGTASEPLLLDAIGRWHFFDPVTKNLTPEASTFVQGVACEAWKQATTSNREHLRANLTKGVSVDSWFEMRWHLGAWLTDDRKDKFSNLFGNHNSLSWLVPMHIKYCWDETR